jgi:dynein heavy chain
MQEAEKFETGVDQKLQKRLTALINKFLELLYVSVCRSLFEKDKLLFSFLLATKMMLVDGELNKEQFRSVGT